MDDFKTTKQTQPNNTTQIININNMVVLNFEQAIITFWITQIYTHLNTVIKAVLDKSTCILKLHKCRP